MKLLIVTQAMDKNDPILGFFVRWVKEFATHYDHIHVIALQVGEHDLPENVTIHSLGKEHLKANSYKLKAWQQVLYAWKFYRLIFQLRAEYNFVFVHMNPEYVVLGGFFWRLWQKRVGLWYVHKSVDLKLRIAEKFVHAIFTASKESFRLPSKKVHVIGHGIDVERYGDTANDNETFTITTIGRFAPSKGIHTLLDAVALLTDIPFQLVIVGGAESEKDKAYEREMHDHADKLGIADKVVFTGAVSPENTPALLAKTDVFASASTTGSVDKAVLEAMAARIPVIAPERAYGELLGGHAVYPEGEASILADMLRRFSALSKEDREKEGEVLRKKVDERYSLKGLIPRIIAIYDKAK